jgi:hypothetical protein
MTVEWVLENADRIGAYILLLAGFYALMTGRLVTPGRLDDHKEVNKLLREENAELRKTMETLNATLLTIAGQQKDTNRILEDLADRSTRRRQAT